MNMEISGIIYYWGTILKIGLSTLYVKDRYIPFERALSLLVIVYLHVHKFITWCGVILRKIDRS